MRERTEVPVVNKEARVVEEISLNKEVTERDETIRDTVRDTEVDIDKLDNTSRRNTNLDSDNI
jgi:stress response protein YsnF